MVLRIKWNGCQVARIQSTQAGGNEHDFCSKHLCIFLPILLRLSGNKISPKGTEKKTLHGHHWCYHWVFSFPIILFQVGERMSSTRNRSKLVFPPTKGKRIDGSSLADHVTCLHTPSTQNGLRKGTSTKCLATAVVGLCQWTRFSRH